MRASCGAIRQTPSQPVVKKARFSIGPVAAGGRFGRKPSNRRRGSPGRNASTPGCGRGSTVTGELDVDTQRPSGQRRALVGLFEATQDGVAALDCLVQALLDRSLAGENLLQTVRYFAADLEEVAEAD